MRKPNREAARRLVEIHELADALSWSLDHDVVADLLWVDRATVEVRMRGLHPSERALLLRATEHHRHD